MQSQVDPALNQDSPNDPYSGLPAHLRAGEIEPVMQKSLRKHIIFTLLAILSVAAFVLISFTGAPLILTVLINALFAGSFVHLAGIAYGIVNDIIGCRKFLPYFSLGHQPQQKGLIESNDPNAVAIAWGIFATSPLTIIAGALFAAATLILGLCSLPFAGFMLPVVALAIPFILYAANRRANTLANERAATLQDEAYFQHLKNSGFEGLNEYQNVHLRSWVKNKDDMNAWFANSDRNVFGFVAMPILGVAALITTIAVTASAHLLPAFMFGAALSVFPPVGLGILLAVSVLAAVAYLYKKHKTQVPGKPYRLDYPNSPVDEPKPIPSSTHADMARIGIMPAPAQSVDHAPQHASPQNTFSNSASSLREHSVFPVNNNNSDAVVAENDWRKNVKLEF